MANYYVTVAGAGDNSGDSWANAMASADFVTHYTTALAAGDNIYIAGGTYTLSADTFANANGTSSNPIKLIGVDSGTTNEPPVQSDWADGDNRPVFDLSGSSNTNMNIGQYSIIRNCRVEGSYIVSGDGLFILNAYSLMVNCYIHNAYLTNTASVSLEIVTSAKVIDTEVTHSNGRGIICTGDYAFLYNCFVHDITTGISSRASTVILNSIFANTTGSAIYTEFNDYNKVINCTFYNCVKGFNSASSGYIHTLLNNTFSDCTDGFVKNSAGTVIQGDYFDYNNWYNNTRDMSWNNGSSENNAAKGNNALAVDPEFVDKEEDNFTLLPGSSLIDAGFTMRLGVA